MILFDTSILTEYLKGNSSITRRVHQIADDEQIGTTVICKYEILLGRFEFLCKANTAADLQRAHQLLIRDERAFESIMIAGIDSHSIRHFEQLRTHRKCRRIGRRDLLIASIALANRATLITRNVKDFALVPSLAYENWMVAS